MTQNTKYASWENNKRSNTIRMAWDKWDKYHIDQLP